MGLWWEVVGQSLGWLKSIPSHILNQKRKKQASRHFSQVNMKEQDRKYSWNWGRWGGAGGSELHEEGPWLSGSQWSLCPSVAAGHLVSRLSGYSAYRFAYFEAYSSHWQEVSRPMMVDGEVGSFVDYMRMQKKGDIERLTMALAGILPGALAIPLSLLQLQVTMCEREKWILNHESSVNWGASNFISGILAHSRGGGLTAGEGESTPLLIEDYLVDSLTVCIWECL